MPDVPGLDLPWMMGLRDGSDRLCHRGVASGRTHIAEGMLKHPSRRPHVSDVADRNDVVRFENSADERPFYAFEREAEIRHLRNQIITLDASEMDACDLVDDAAILQRQA